MSGNRVTRACRFLRAVVILWVVLVPLAQLLHAPHLASPRRAAIWQLSLGLLGLVWADTALWSGAVHLGYRGIHARTVYRSEAPSVFRWHVAIGIGLAIIVLGLAIYHLQHNA